MKLNELREGDRFLMPATDEFPAEFAVCYTEWEEGGLLAYFDGADDYTELALPSDFEVTLVTRR